MKDNNLIEQVNTDALIPYVRNSRTHSEAQVAQIAGSIREFGFINPVLIDTEDGIIAGHGRVLAAQKLGLQVVPCIRLAHLTEIQKQAYIIADNKLAMNAGWDDAMLACEFADLMAAGYDADMTGFTDTEIKILMGYGIDMMPGTEDDQGRLDEKSPTICPACGHEFHK